MATELDFTGHSIYVECKLCYGEYRSEACIRPAHRTPCRHLRRDEYGSCLQCGDRVILTLPEDPCIGSDYGRTEAQGEQGAAPVEVRKLELTAGPFRGPKRNLPIVRRCATSAVEHPDTVRTFDVMQLADRITQMVAEIPDRFSPEDDPRMMMVRDNELREIVIEALDAARNAG